MYLCESDWFTQYGPVWHWVHCKSTSHPPPPSQPVSATVDMWSTGRGECWYSSADFSFMAKEVLLFFLLLILLFRSVCHQVWNQADKLVLLAIFIISRRFAHVVKWVSQGRIRGGGNCPGPPRDEIYLFQIKYSFEKFCDSEAIQ